MCEVKIYRLFSLEVSNDTMTKCGLGRRVEVEQNDSYIGISIEGVGSLANIAVSGDLRLKCD
jgi:hypothetical protein